MCGSFGIGVCIPQPLLAVTLLCMAGWGVPEPISDAEETSRMSVKSSFWSLPRVSCNKLSFLVFIVYGCDVHTYVCSYIRMYAHVHVRTYILPTYVQYPSISIVVRHTSYSTYVPKCKCMFINCMSCVRMYCGCLVSQMWYSPDTETIP